MFIKQINSILMGLITMFGVSCLGPGVVNKQIAVTDSNTPKFPQVVAENLHGQQYSLPKDFERELNIVFIAFLQEQQNDVNTWLNQMDDLLKPFPTVAYYELPTITHNMGSFSRFYLNNGMRMGIPDSAARARTITIYVDKAAFKQALHIPTENTIYTLVLDKTGSILWQTTGRFDAAKGASLTQFLQGAVK